LGDGAISFGANARINLSLTTGIQYIKSDVVLPHVGIIGGQLVLWPMNLDTTHFSGNLIIKMEN
jgi:hypothetical protein